MTGTLPTSATGAYSRRRNSTRTRGRTQLALALLLVSRAALAQPAGSGTIIQIPLDESAPHVSAAASPSQVKLGAPFTVFVTAEYEPGVTVNLREPIDLGGAFEVRRHVVTDTPRADGKHVREWQLEVYAWDLGDLEIPPIAVTFVAHGHAAQVATNSVPVRSVGVLGDADDPKLMRAYAPPVALVQRTWLWWLVHDPRALGTALGAVLLSMIAWRRPWRRRPREPERAPKPPAPQLEPIVPARHHPLDMTSARALERLAEIERSGALDGEATRKLGYADMADVIREFAGARFGIAAARELTSGELVAELARAAGERERDLVAAWLERCDPVKYGGGRATAEGAKAVLAGARALVAAIAGSPSASAGEGAAL